MLDAQNMQLCVAARFKHSCPAFPDAPQPTPAHAPQVRDADLDVLERVAPCITWGDLEAEDPRHLNETNFTKIFRLAQLLIEYLLYVQVSCMGTVDQGLMN